MTVKEPSICGTLESSDIMIQLSPGRGEIEIELESSVDMFYHEVILERIREVLEEEGIDSVKVRAVDHGALDCTIRARTLIAVRRAMKEAET